MSSFARSSSYGPVAIIPASAIRENQNILRTSIGGGQRRRREAEDVPINLAYYMSPRRPPSPQLQQQFTTAPVMYSNPQQHQSAYFTTPRAPPSSYYTPRTPPRTPPSAARSRTTPREYRTRSYTAPSTVFSGPVIPRASVPVAVPARSSYTQRYPDYRRYARSRSDVVMSSPSVIFTERDFANHHIGDVKAFSGPIKYPEPMYKKHRHTRSRSEVIVGGGSSIVAATPPQRRRYVYPPSYATYPPSTVASKRLDGSRYNIFLRVALKIAQLICGAIVIGCISGPTHGEAFHTFVLRTRSDGQLYVMIVACLCLIVTSFFLIFVWLANRSQGWRNGDGAFSAFAAFAYLVAGCVESWYAACYPPYGIMFPEACRIGAWVAAAVFAFFNMVFYTVDFAYAAQTGIDIL